MSDPGLHTASANMLIFLFLLSITESTGASSVYFEDIPKCCDTGSVFVEQNDSFFCNHTENNRMDIQTIFAADLNNSKIHTCVESVNLNLFLFNRTSEKVYTVRNINDKVFPKCCPRNYFYNQITHSCEESIINNTISTSFIRIGLRNCNIIFDYFFDSLSDIIVKDNENIYIPSRNEEIHKDNYCRDETVGGTNVVRVCQKSNICKTVLCIHKCCPDGQSFINGSHCKDTYEYGMNLSRFSTLISNISAPYAIIHGYETGVYIGNIKNHFIDDKGNFHSFQEKIGSEIYSPEEETYCIEHATKNGRLYGHTLFRIIPRVDYMEKKFLYNRWAMIFSNAFLVITVVYYVISRETRKVFGKALVSYCVALFFLFAIITFGTFKKNLNTSETMTACKTIGFSLMYLAFSCFLWLQVMCFDIYWTFGSAKRYSSFNNKQGKDFKRFLCYSLYGWGVPLLVTLILILLHFMDDLPESIKIKMGETKCYMERGEGNYADIVFYIIPVSIIQCVNVIFFIKTVTYCLQVKANIQKMNQSSDLQKKKNRFESRKERFKLVVKLSIVMGFFYLFEIMSSVYDFKKNIVSEHIEIIWDLINCLQGFFIFIIFVCKTKYFQNCCRKVTMDNIRKISLTTMSSRTNGISSERKSNRESRNKDFNNKPE